MKICLEEDIFLSSAWYFLFYIGGIPIMIAIFVIITDVSGLIHCLMIIRNIKGQAI